MTTRAYLTAVIVLLIWAMSIACFVEFDRWMMGRYLAEYRHGVMP